MRYPISENSRNIRNIKTNYLRDTRRSKNSLLFLPVVLLSLCLSCAVTSKNPLGKLEDSKRDERLLGGWYGIERERHDTQEVSYVVFLPLRENRFRVVYIPAESEVMQFHGFVSRIGDETYLNLASLQLLLGYIGLIDPDSYVLVHYRINENGELEISLFSESFFKQAIEAGSIKGKLKTEKDLWGTDVELADSTENLIKFIKQNTKKEYLEEPFIILKKLKK
ncbi:MAG: hypothetical protein Q7J55_02160 [bacterium]|nr:hypothetical protein [bacterium]